MYMSSNGGSWLEPSLHDNVISPEISCAGSFTVIYWCRLLITFANSLDPDKMSGLIWIQTVWHSDGIPERFFSKKLIC